MKLVIFGLTITSSWGNGHATLWRGLCRALARRGHELIFFERDVPYYASQRDLRELPGTSIRLYSDWEEVRTQAREEIVDADIAMVTSYCPDGAAASVLVRDSCRRMRVFYDMDTPVTLDHLDNGEPVPYLDAQSLRDFDLVLSFTGGAALDHLRQRLHARKVAPLYGSVDPEMYAAVEPLDVYRCDLSYLGTYASDRQDVLSTLFLEPAEKMTHKRFLVGGALYPQEFPWSKNTRFIGHVSPPLHPAFYSSSRMTLNITRIAMARMGFCPSGRLFEASACGIPALSDWWQGLDEFFDPGSELVVARTSDDVKDALSLSDKEMSQIGRAARERTLACHTAERRALELERLIESPVS